MLRSRIIAFSDNGKLETIKETLNEEGKVIETCKISCFGSQEDLRARLEIETLDKILQEEIIAKRYIVGSNDKESLDRLSIQAKKIAKEKMAEFRISRRINN